METIKIEWRASNCTALRAAGKMRVAIQLNFWHLHVTVKCLFLFSKFSRIFYTHFYVLYESQLVTET